MNLQELMNGRKLPERDAQDEIVQNIANVYETNFEKYRHKSIAWVLRITAEEVGLEKDALVDILNDYYGDEEGEEVNEEDIHEE